MLPLVLVTRPLHLVSYDAVSFLPLSRQPCLLKLKYLGVQGIVSGSRSQENVDKALKELQSAAGSADRVRGKKCDTSECDDVASLMAFTNDAFRHIQYVFANGSATGWWFADFSKPPEKPDLSVTDKMVKGAAYTIHAAAPYLAKSPAADKAIIVTGSEASF